MDISRYEYIRILLSSSVRMSRSTYNCTQCCGVFSVRDHVSAQSKLQKTYSVTYKLADLHIIAKSSLMMIQPNTPSKPSTAPPPPNPLSTILQSCGVKSVDLMRNPVSRDIFCAVKIPNMFHTKYLVPIIRLLGAESKYC
jgi:hypothetical protein